MCIVFDYENIETCEKEMRKSWEKFKDCLAKHLFTYKDIDKAKSEMFLKVYDNLFQQNQGLNYNTITVKKLMDQDIGRGTVLKGDEKINYERFIPKEEYIKIDNRFSPQGVEWLYLAIGNDSDIHECAKAECRANKGDRFGFCHFEIDYKYADCKLVDLTIADDMSYREINKILERCKDEQFKKICKNGKMLGKIPSTAKRREDVKKAFMNWGVLTYSKLLSEQIFIPLEVNSDKSIEYAPFQTLAQYYISLGYLGIVFGSTVSSVGKNIVLFDKTMAFPTGLIEDYIV